MLYIQHCWSDRADRQVEKFQCSPVNACICRCVNVFSELWQCVIDRKSVV